MKKIMSLLLALLMAFMVVGCASSTSNQEAEETAAVEKQTEKNEEQGNQKTADKDNSNLDWALEYINKDISILRDEVSGGKYMDDYGQSLDYEYHDFTLRFGTDDEMDIEIYSEDYKKAGITKNTITSISLNLSNELYDDENSTIIRYPEISIGKVRFGMDISEDEKFNKNNDTYSMECYDNSVYAKGKIVGIQIESQLKIDVFNGNYAPEFAMKPLDENASAKVIGVGMNKEEIVHILGSDYEEETYEDEIEGGTCTSLQYEGVTVGLNGENGKADYIVISTNKVSGGFDFSVGDSAREVLNYCQDHYEPVINMHGAENEFLFGVFEIGEGVSVSLIFDNYGNINSMEDIKEDTVLQQINILNTAYLWGV